MSGTNCVLKRGILSKWLQMKGAFQCEEPDKVQTFSASESQSSDIDVDIVTVAAGSDDTTV